jgi:hypothetical protein
MKTKEKKATADALTERSVWVRVGLLPIMLRPLTLGQIFEMGEYVNDLDVEGIDMKKKMNVVAEMLTKFRNAPLMQETFMVCAYRRRWKRWLFRRYILKRLTVRHFSKVIEVLTNAYTANFFLTSIIFLHQTKTMTEPKQTTPLGQQSEE